MEPMQQGVVHPTAIISPTAELGVDVTVGPFTIIHDGVRIGDRCIVGSHSVIGEPPGSVNPPGAEVPATVIGDDGHIRSYALLYQGTTIGQGIRAGNRVTIREGCRIGDDVQLGSSAEIRDEVEIADHCRIQSGVGLAPRTVLEEFVWLFPWVAAVDDPHPPSDTCTRPPIVRRYAVVATLAVLLPGVEVGEHAMVGAMSLVSRDVPAETLVAGRPAKPVGSVRDVTCRHGELDEVYPWPVQFRRGFPDGALPPPDEFR